MHSWLSHDSRRLAILVVTSVATTQRVINLRQLVLFQSEPTARSYCVEAGRMTRVGRRGYWSYDQYLHIALRSKDSNRASQSSVRCPFPRRPRHLTRRCTVCMLDRTYGDMAYRRGPNSTVRHRDDSPHSDGKVGHRRRTVSQEPTTLSFGGPF